MKPRLDPLWLDAEYNNRARVADHAQVLGRWAQASALVRGQRGTHLDVAYGTGVGETLDIFLTAAPKAPVLVFLHGGYWRSLDKSDRKSVV